MHESIVDVYVEEYIKNSWTRKDLLRELFSYGELKNMYQNEIRRATVVGHITNEVLLRVGSTDFCKIFAIGDIAYFDNLAHEWETLISSSLSNISPANLQGYDLGGLGTPELRSNITQYMSYYYNLSLLPDSLENHIIPSYGGTDSFVTILNTLKSSVGNRIRFIYPEASFLANVKIAELFLHPSNCLSIQKPDSQNFFCSVEQIRSLYSENLQRTDTNIFYITPVGNPTGNTISGESIYEVIQEVQKLDPGAIFIFDTVYVGLLSNTESHKLFQCIFSNASLMQRIIFTESISKTLGTTGIRLGWTWTLNVDFSNELKKYTTLTKAGFSKILDQFTSHLLTHPDVPAFQDRVYEFWSHKRLSFLAYMKAYFSSFFDFESSPSISDREGIYVLLKIAGNFSKEEVFAETGIIGVGITLSDGEYIRYAFGNVQYF